MSVGELETRAVSGPGPLATARALAAGQFLAMPGFLAACSRDYGPISSFKIFGRRVFFLDDAAAIGEVLVAKNRSFKKGRGLERMRILLGDGLLTSEEPLHLQRRRVAQPAFHRERIDAYAATMVASTQHAIANWNDGQPRDVAHDLGRLTLEITSKALFGADVSADAADIAAALTDLIALFPSLMSPLGALRARLPLPSTKRFARAKAKLDRAVDCIIAQESARPHAARPGVLSLMMSSHLEDGNRLDKRALRDESLTFLLAGHETTANALAWTLFLLAQHPDEQRTARAEAIGLGDALDGNAVEALPFLAACFKESMRLYPPAWIIGRRAVENVRILGADIPKDDIVIMSPYVTQRNARYYDAPAEFRPRRWLGSIDIPRFAYFPFGGGNRVCIGEPFAWLEGVIVLSVLLRSWTFEPTSRTSGEVQPIVTLRPKNGMTLRVARHAQGVTPLPQIS